MYLLYTEKKEEEREGNGLYPMIYIDYRGSGFS
jgi:hypothetical protein